MGVVSRSQQTSQRSGRPRSRPAAFGRAGVAATLAACLLISPLLSQSGAVAERVDAGDAVAERMRVVDCLLQGQVKKIGRHMTFMSKRRPARLPAGECEIRGGEYVAYDRADLTTSLGVWMPAAMDGDSKAQLYVGELMERGADGGAPDYAMAKLWYERAADQGEAAAMFNLGRLFEQGLGVAANKEQAADWYAKAYGFDSAELAQAVNFKDRETIAALESTIAANTTQIAALETSVASLRRERDDAVAERQAVEAEIRERDAALKESEATIAQVTADLAASRRDHAQALADYRTALDDVAQTKAELAPERAAVSAETDQLNDRVRSLTRLRDTISKDIAEELSTLEALRGETNALMTARAALELDQERLDALTDEQRVMAIDNQKRATELAGLQRRLDERLAALSGREQALAERETALAAQLADGAQRQSANINAQRAAIRDEQAAVSASRAALKADIASLTNGLTRLGDQERSLIALQAEAAERARVLSEREAALAASERDLAERARTLASADDAKRAAIAAAQDMQARLAEELDAVEAERRSMTNRRSALDSRAQELVAAEAELAARATRLDARATTLARRQQDVDVRETRIAELESAARQAEEKLNALQAIILGNQRALSTADSAPAPTVQPRRIRVDFGDYHAILIGNANYGDPDWPDLDTPHNDVARIDEILRERYGFRTTVLLDASREQILLAIENASNQLDQDDNLLIYYAGHGKYSADAQTGFWEPVDSIAYAYRRSISAQDINFYLSTIKARKVLVVSDSCYSGAFTRDLVDVIDTDSFETREKYFMTLAAKKSRVVMTAGGLQPVPDGLGNGHSLFARAFINALVDNDDVALARDLFGRIRQVVVNNALAARFDQEPLYADMVHSGHEGGDFIFVPKSG